MKQIVLAAAAATLLAFAAPAHADAPQERVERRVSFADLDLGADEGAKAAMRRLNRAVRQVCGDATGRLSLTQRREFRKCYQANLATAVEDLGAPMVTALYQRMRSVKPVRYA